LAYDASADQVSTGFKGYAGIFAQRRKYDYSDKVIQKARVHAKLFNMLSKNLTKMSVTELEPRIFEFTEENDVIAINNNPGTTTTFEFANVDAQMLQQHDVLYVLIASITSAPSQETLKVVSIGAKDGGPSGAGYTAVTVRRGGTPINITDGSAYNVIWGGNSVAENAAGSQPRTKEPNYTYNYLQLFDKTVGESKDVQNSQFYAKQFFSINGEATRKRDMLMRNINWTMYLNERDRETAEDGNYKHYTGGAYEIVPTANKLSLSGLMTINYWNEKTSTTWFKNGNDRHEKFLFAGPKFLVEFENMYTQYYQLPVNQTLSKFYGIQIKSVQFSGGTIHFVREEAFLGSGYTDCAFLLDMDYLAYMYLVNRDMQVDKDVTNPEERWNKIKWKLFGRIGLFRSYDAAHHFLYAPSAPA
jgi:hypothetical protein